MELKSKNLGHRFQFLPPLNVVYTTNMLRINQDEFGLKVENNPKKQYSYK